MKAIILFIILSVISFCKVLELNSDFEYINAKSYIEYYKDIDNKYDIKNINTAQWQPMVNSNLGGMNSYYSWTKLNIQNTNTKKTIVLKNPRAGIDELIVYIKKDGNTTTHILGDNNDIKLRVLQHRYSAFALYLDINESVEIISKLSNKIGETNGNWDVYTQGSFDAFSNKEAYWWGLVIGISLALFCYSIPIIFSSKDKLLGLFFALYVVSSLVYQLYINGIMYSFGFSHEYINIMTLLFGALFGLFTVLVMIRFFIIIDCTKGFLWKLMIAMVVFFIIEVVLVFLSLFDSKILILCAKFSVYGGILGYTFWFLLLYQFIKLSHNKIFVYMFMGYTTVFLAYMFLALVSAGVIDTSIISLYGVSIANVIEIYFFALAISQYIKNLQEEQNKKDKMINFQMKFASIGRCISNISHQWRIPLVRVGTLLMELEASIYTKNSYSKSDLEAIIEKFRENIGFMQSTLDEFYNIYRQDVVQKPFDIVASTNSVLSMLSAKIILSNATVNLDTQKSAIINGSENSFTHIMMILIDNALNIAKQRDINLPIINIAIENKQDSVVINVEDNCGGISQKPIEAIFDIDISSHSEEESMGLGLNIVKTLIQEQFGGTINVANIDYGAVFSITLKK